MSLTLRHVVRAQRALLAARQMPRLCTPVSTTVARALPSTLDDGASKTHDHSLHFKCWFGIPRETFGNCLDTTIVTISHNVYGPPDVRFLCIERYFAAAMVPLFPAAYFIHGPVMDAVLTVALTLHIHWGVQGVVQDYARPFVIGDTLAKTARACVYLITAAILAGLLHFNTNDVGLTEAFRLVFAL